MPGVPALTRKELSFDGVDMMWHDLGKRALMIGKKSFCRSKYARTWRMSLQNQDLLIDDILFRHKVHWFSTRHNTRQFITL
ncbi:hypothetical protein Tco_0859613 [Tanacetum coccineum]|uniref:Uncharacterized protein n=1 Tax=Tanacetum coccineum TaxID=301880 RepID=A0ABQ5BG42_9ASTR